MSVLVVCVCVCACVCVPVEVGVDLDVLPVCDLHRPLEVDQAVPAQSKLNQLNPLDPTSSTDGACALIATRQDQTCFPDLGNEGGITGSVVCCISLPGLCDPVHLDAARGTQCPLTWT